ncbi:MAG: DUF6531 domain-containing protein [Solirubrobacteraceae bacterium]
MTGQKRSSRFVLLRPFVEDARGNRGAIKMVLTHDASGWEVSVSLSRRWLDASSRRFPVTIDPTTTTAADVYCSIAASSPEASICGDGTSGVANVGGGDEASNMLMHFDVAGAIPADSEVLSATLTAQFESADNEFGNAQESTVPVSLDVLSRAFTTAATWDTANGTDPWTLPGGDYSSPGEVQTVDASGSAATLNWDATGIVRSWLNGTEPNDGAALVGPSDLVGQLSFATGSSAPYLSIDYVARAGELFNSTVNRQLLSSGLSYGINVANGDFLVSDQELDVPGTGENLELTQTYNSLLTGSINSGNGWRTDSGIDQLLEIPGDATQPTVYDAGDGREYPFAPNGSGGFDTPTGISATLTENSDGTYTLAFASGTTMSFNSTGQLTALADSSADTIGYAYSSSTGGPTTITDTGSNTYTPTYDPSTGLLSSVSEPDDTSLQYGYNPAGDLTTFTDASDNEVIYGYNTSNELTAITDPANTVQITYNANRQVTQVVYTPYEGTAETTTYAYYTPATAPVGCGAAPNGDSLYGETVETAPDGTQTAYCHDADDQVWATSPAPTGAPSDTSAPAVSGTASSGSQLTATTGDWSGSGTLTQDFQWLSCDANGENCNPIPDAENQTYTPTPQDVGSTIEVSVSSSNTLGTSTVTSLATGVIEPATGPSCTDSWIGPADGDWNTAANWSTGSAPSSTDVACARAGSKIEIDTGDAAGSLQAAGATLVATAGELQLADSSNPSELGVLDLRGATASIAGPLTIDTALNWTTGTLTGTGTTTLAATAFSTITPAVYGDSPMLDGTVLDNDGQLTLNCALPTDALGASVLGGANSAELNNNGTLAFGSNWTEGTAASQLCTLAQGTGSAPTVTNDGTVNAAAPTFVGWAFTNASDGIVNDQPSSNVYLAHDILNLAGGEGSTAEAGQWLGGVDLMAGSYSFSASTQMDGYTGSQGNSYITVGIGAGDGNPLDALLGTDPTAASLTLPAVNWPDTNLAQYSGTVTIGDTADATTLPEIDTYAGNLTLNSPNATASTIPYLDFWGGNDTTNGATDASELYVGAESWQPATAAATYSQNGTLTLNENDGYVGLADGSTFHQNGTLIFPIGSDSDAGFYSDTWWNAGPTTDWPVIDGGGTTIFQDAVPSGGRCYAAYIGTSIVFANQQIDNESSVCGAAIYGPTVFENSTIQNDGTLQTWDEILGSSGTSLLNNGELDSDGAYFGSAPGGGQPELDNVGSMIDDLGTDANLIGWSSSGGGTVQSNAYNFDSGSNDWYGGSSPSSPYQQTPTCGDPVVCATGDQTEQETDLSFSGLGGLSLQRNYNSQLAAAQITPGMFGYGWTSSFDGHLWINTTNGNAVLQQPNGSTTDFTSNPDGSFAADQGVQATLTQNTDGSYVFTLPSQQSLTFSSDGDLESETSSTGQTTSLQYTQWPAHVRDRTLGTSDHVHLQPAGAGRDGHRPGGPGRQLRLRQQREPDFRIGLGRAGDDPLAVRLRLDARTDVTDRR